MLERILITGGAGFVGSHVTDELLRQGHSVRVLDSLTPQAHGPHARRPAYLDSRAELIVGDVRNPESVRAALEGVDAVVHLAAAVGVGQSMYRIREYLDVNTVGTAVLLEELAKKPVKKLVVASSMSVYGEGRYLDTNGGVVDDAERALERMRGGSWDPVDRNGVPLVPVPTPENKPVAPSCIYALSKYDQERMCLLFGQAYRVPTVALRLFNTYGPRQALSNPYTGVLAIFAARLMNGKSPMLFEDGAQRRDFVHVADVARAFGLALTRSDADSKAVNVASGSSVSIAEVARRLAETLERPKLRAVVTGKCRVGDVRHCLADIGAVRSLLGFEPSVDLAMGMLALARWLESEPAIDHTETAQSELETRGLAL
jgi:dTDP-L-rhamnose 4-epimerase